MASFMPVHFANMPGYYINLDLVRTISPLPMGCIVHFDNGHTIGINESADAVVAAAEHVRQTERR
jgi:hypothetical protein